MISYEFLQLDLIENTRKWTGEDTVPLLENWGWEVGQRTERYLSWTCSLEHPAQLLLQTNKC